ncbi:hypothetical protein ACRAWD_11920 [Caulobacter segnis]
MGLPVAFENRLMEISVGDWSNRLRDEVKQGESHTADRPGMGVQVAGRRDLRDHHGPRLRLAGRAGARGPSAG